AEGAEGRRHVPEDRQWMHQALIEAERVHERLQGRAGRTLRENSVDLAVDLVVEVAGRSDKRLDLHRLRVDEERGGIADARGSMRVDVAPDHALDGRLHAHVDA